MCAGSESAIYIEYGKNNKKIFDRVAVFLYPPTQYW
jgi:hypothetical protein